MRGVGIQLAGLLIALLGISLGLAGATYARSFYQRSVQRPHCLEYAARTGIPDLDTLEFQSVVISHQRFNSHICIFRRTTSGELVSVEFDQAEIPRLRDTLEVASMIAAFVIGILPPLALQKLFSPTQRSPGTSLLCRR
jgi:hypothetical protein